VDVVSICIKLICIKKKLILFGAYSSGLKSVTHVVIIIRSVKDLLFKIFYLSIEQGSLL